MATAEGPMDQVAGGGLAIFLIEVSFERVFDRRIQ